MEYDFTFWYVFVLDTQDHSDQVWSKSEGVTWGPLVDLTRNDPYVISSPVLIVVLVVGYGRVMFQIPQGCPTFDAV